MAKVRHYTIEVKDVDTKKTVLLAAADWDDHEMRVAPAQIMRLAGVPDDAGACFLDEAALDVGPRKS